jgi:hypothetical protein
VDFTAQNDGSNSDKMMNQAATQAIIRQRQVPSLRRCNGLLQYAANRTSQHGEDGIIAKMFQILQQQQQQQQTVATPRYCVDVGAWDGRHWSNTYSLLVNEETAADHSSQEHWHGVLLEADTEKFDHLQALHRPAGHVCQQVSVAVTPENQQRSLPMILMTIQQQQQADVSSWILPPDFDFLCIDIDGVDYWVWHDLLSFTTPNGHSGVSRFRPKLVCIEFNPTMPPDVIYIPPRSDSIRQGASLAALIELATKHAYVLVETTLYNAFFVTSQIYHQHAELQRLVPDTTQDALHQVTMGTSLYQLYDGTIKLHGCQKLLWHRRPILESQIQAAIWPPSATSRWGSFPFAPNATEPPSFDQSTAVIDLSSYCQPSMSNVGSEPYSNKEQLLLLLEQLQNHGFCHVRGTGMAGDLCAAVLQCTQDLLYTADEAVRRSCFSATDRARRGYSPTVEYKSFSSAVSSVFLTCPMSPLTLVYREFCFTPG